MAPLQKRALYSLITGLVLAIVVAVILAMQGDITTFENNANLRLVLYIGVVGVPLIYLILVNLTLRRPTQLDERDKSIMDRSGKVQWLLGILTLVGWTIALTEMYSDTGQVPVAYLYLIFVSTLIVGTLAQSLGILLGYWRMDRNG